MPASLSLAIVGADYLNKRGPTRRFEIALCVPGEPLELRPEPNNRHDEYAIAVYSCRGVQIGYLTAERAPWIGKLLREAADAKIKPQVIFQRASRFGAYARAAFDGSTPALPVQRDGPESHGADPEAGFWPDEIPPDE